MVFDIPVFAKRFKNLVSLTMREDCSPLHPLKRVPDSGELVDLGHCTRNVATPLKKAKLSVEAVKSEKSLSRRL
jgi:hypothetical protein